MGDCSMINATFIESMTARLHIRAAVIDSDHLRDASSAQKTANRTSASAIGGVSQQPVRPTPGCSEWRLSVKNSVSTRPERVPLTILLCKVGATDGQQTLVITAPARIGSTASCRFSCADPLSVSSNIGAWAHSRRVGAL